MAGEKLSVRYSTYMNGHPKIKDKDLRDYKIAETALHEKSKKRYTWKDIEKIRKLNTMQLLLQELFALSNNLQH